MKTLLMTLGLTAATLSFGQQSTTTIDTSIDSVKVWILPGANGQDLLEVRGRVIIGGNSCRAKGASASMVYSVQGGKGYVTPYLTRPSSLGQCSSVYSPVYQDVYFQLRGTRPALERVVIRSVDQLGRDRVVKDLMTP